jgi:hypothetical protein
LFFLPFLQIPVLEPQQTLSSLVHAHLLIS